MIKTADEILTESSQTKEEHINFNSNYSSRTRTCQGTEEGIRWPTIQVLEANTVQGEQLKAPQEW